MIEYFSRKLSEKIKKRIRIVYLKAHLKSVYFALI